MRNLGYPPQHFCCLINNFKSFCSFRRSIQRLNSCFRFYSIAKNVICRRAGSSNSTNGGSINMSPLFHHQQQQQQQQRRPLLRRGNSFHLDETTSFPESGGSFFGNGKKKKRGDERFMTRTRLRPGGPAPATATSSTTATLGYGTPQPALKREVFNGTTFLRLNNNKDSELDGGLEMAASSGYFTPLVKQKTLTSAAQCESPRVQPVATMMRTTRVVYSEAPPVRGINHEAAV